MYLGCVRDSAVLPLFAAGECPCCRGAAGDGAARPGLRRRPNCHLLEIIEICVLKFVLHCTCMKCSSVFRTTVVKVIVDNAPPTRGRGCRRHRGRGVAPGRGVPAGAWRVPRGTWRDREPGFLVWQSSPGHGQPPTTGPRGAARSCLCPTSRRGGGSGDRARRGAARRRPLLSLVVSLCHSLYIVVTMS